MAGEIPDSQELDDLFKKDKAPVEDGLTAEMPTFDDATTNYTKEEPGSKPLLPSSKEPIAGS